MPSTDWGVGDAVSRPPNHVLFRHLGDYASWQKISIIRQPQCSRSNDYL